MHFANTTNGQSYSYEHTELLSDFILWTKRILSSKLFSGNFVKLSQKSI